MGTIKFEIDLPEFEKELSINVTIHRDGEVVYTTTSSPSVDNTTNLLSSGSQRKIEQEKINNTSVDRESTIIENEAEKPKKSVTPTRRKGNMMNLDL